MPQHFIKPGADWGKASAVGLSLAICVACPAWAQTTAPVTAGVTASKVELTFPDVEITEKSLEFRQFEKVEITGSAILAKEAKQALPLQILDRRDIERSGAASLPELLQRLPLMSNFFESGTVTGTVAGGPEAAAIHGNQGGTLVLLNGRRLPYYGSQAIMIDRSVVDLNFLPLAAVEKIEILTDGASSRYGSDAVAGVINVITKTDIQGLSVGVEATVPQDGHGHSKGVNLSWGKGRLQRDGYSLRAHFTAQKTEAVLAKHREVSSQGARSMQIDGKTWWLTQNYSAYSAPAKNYLDANGDLKNTYYLQTGQCEPGWYELGRGKCFTNTQGEMTLYPEVNKQLLYLQGDRMLANRWVVFAEGLLGQQKFNTVAGGDYNTKDVLGPDGNTYLLDIVPLGLMSRQQYVNHIGNIALGLRGEQYGWDFVTSVSSGRHRVRRDYIGGAVTNGFAAATLPPEIVGQHPSQYSADTLALLRQYQGPEKEWLDDAFSQIDSFNFLASREWMETDYGPASVGAGLDWRRERVYYTARDKETRPGFDASRLVWAAHLELSSPVGPHSEVTAAARYDQYSDFGGVQTAKLGWKWQPERAWLFRASVGTGFRAPNIAQMVPISSTIAGYMDSFGNEISVKSGGNPMLRPEKSLQRNLGFRYEPNQRWSLGADLWQLDIRDTFGYLTIEEILNNPGLKAKFFDQQLLTQTNQNLGRSVKRGLDYDIHWRQPTDLGRVRTSLKGVYMLKSAKEDAVDRTWVSNIGTHTSPFLTTARHQWSLTSMLERPQWVGGFTLHYKTGYDLETTLYDKDNNWRNETTRVPGHWTLDLLSRWQIQPKLTLSAHLINATNRMPALRMGIQDNALLGVDTRYANYMGRNLQLKLDYKF